MNPTPYRRREIDNRGIYRWAAWASILSVAVAVVLVWSFVTPPPVTDTALPVMIVWIAIVVAAVTAIILTLRTSPARGRYVDYLKTNTVILLSAAILVTILGVTAAFLSGDKFDCLRAAAIAVVLIIAGYPRQKYWAGESY